MMDSVRLCSWRTGVIAALFIGLLSLVLQTASAQSNAPVELPDTPSASEAADQAAPGVSLTIESVQAAGKAAVVDSRLTRMVAIYVPQGTPPSSLTPAGPFRATFEGDLNLKLREEIAFSAEGRGKLALSFANAPVLETSGEDLSQKSAAVKLKKGKNHFIAIYESPASGDASLRLFWAPKNVRPEPVPPTILTHSISAKPLVIGERVREGRFLLANLRCLKCHTADDGTGASSKHAMPELAMDAPSLEDAGARLNADWLAAWINNPRAFRPDPHMPRIFHAAGDDKSIDPRAQDVAAYLASLGSAPDAAPDPAKADEGGRLFAHLNCIACHSTPDAEEAADASRVPLRHVRAKFKPAALTQYLQAPEAHYAWNPMPNFRLSADEASSLAAFLLSTSPANAIGGAAGDPAKGKELVRSSGCLNCHTLKLDNAAKAAPLAAISKSQWNQGCMAADAAARKNAPDYAPSDEQRTALLSFAATDRTSLGRSSPPEFAERQVADMRCTACHARDMNESLLATSLSAELLALQDKYKPVDPPNVAMAPDQRPPILTWVGEKLRPEWAAKFIAGEIPYKPRYFLRARMPAFKARAALLATGLAEEHGCPPVMEPYPKPDVKQVPIGRTLTGKAPNQSFSCIQCHAVADVPPFAPFEAPSVNFMYATERLRKDYYHRWVHDPLRMDPNTKMPRFDDVDGKTGIKDVYDGDAIRQYEAIWQYFLTGRNIQPPAG